MGIEIADFDNNFQDDIFTSVIYEGRHINWGNNFYLNLTTEKDQNFHNTSKQNRTFNCGWAWGVAAVDLDLDGELELFIANGNITRENKARYDFEAMTTMSLPVSLMKDDRYRSPSLLTKSYAGRQRDCLFYKSNGRYWDIGPLVGVNDRLDGRAVIRFDYNNDGRLDLFVTNQDNFPILYKNEAVANLPQNNWIGVSLKIKPGSEVNTDGDGTQISLFIDGKRTQQRTVRPGNGYLTQNDNRIIFGLGNIGASAKVKVALRWTDGKTITIPIEKLNRYVEIER
jgi:hypothetical protein